MSWYPRISTGKLNFFRAIPKVDLHRHLEGSLRLATIVEVANTAGADLPLSLPALVQMQQDDPLTFQNFLSKFQYLRQIYRSPEIITRVAREAVLDAAADGVQYLELRFTPVALARLQSYPLGEVMDWVLAAVNEAARENHITVRLIANVNRHEAVAQAEEVARLAVERRGQGIVGLDLAGNESEFSAVPFEGVFRAARQSGLRITAHAGEWGGPSNVRHAIECLGAERIGHGVRVMEDPAVVALARERKVAFEVCLTSNYQSGVVASIAEHPLVRMLNAGLVVTLNTDDPGISRITLSDEYRLALDVIGLPPAMLMQCIQASARAAFLSPAESAAFTTRIAQQLTTSFA